MTYEGLAKRFDPGGKTIKWRMVKNMHEEEQEPGWLGTAESMPGPTMEVI